MSRTKQVVSSSNPAIAGVLRVLAEVVGQTVEAVGEAQALLADGKELDAIRALDGAEQRLWEGISLHQAILTMHRYR
jgi:hypothetical protein